MASWWDNFTSVAGDTAAGAYEVLNPGASWDQVQAGWAALQGWWGGGVSASGAPQAGGARPTPGAPGDLGSLLQQLLGGGAGGSGGAASGPAGYTTRDGVFVVDGSPEDRYYKLVDAVWTRVFGSHPDFAQARIFQQMGVENTDQLNQIVLQMPSNIKAPDGTPINIGTYEDMITTGNKFGQQYFGRPIPDSLITQWVGQGVTTPDAISNWFYSHPAADIPKDQYGAIWDAANQWTQNMNSRFSG